MSGMRLSMRVWDLPVRLFHAAVILLLAACYATLRTHHPGWHVLAGEALLALLMWRAVWFVVGSDTARAAAWLVPPGRAGDHPGHRPGRRFGHAEAGGWLVLALLGLLGAQALSGLFARAGAGVARAHAVGGWVVLGAIALHVLALAVFGWRRWGELGRSMVTGKRRMPAALKSPRMAAGSLALLVLLCAAGLLVLLLNAFGR